MSNASRFTSSAAATKNTQDRLSSTTVGLATLDDFRKRRAEVLEEQEREAREAVLGNPTPPNRSRTSTPVNTADSTSAGGPSKKRKKKEKRKGGISLSFDADTDEVDEEEAPVLAGSRRATGKRGADGKAESEDSNDPGRQPDGATAPKKKLSANTNVGVVPKTVTKVALRKQAAEREALRKEFLARQTRVKETEIAIPFVFYDGSDIPGGVVTVKKGDFVWLFLDRSRKVGAQLGVGGEKNSSREWARVGIDDLLLVRGGLIIPHHYELYFFIINKNVGPGGRILFDYAAEAEAELETGSDTEADANKEGLDSRTGSYDPLAASKRKASFQNLEGARDDPRHTKVVDRRWYERNKHIYPASAWQQFDPEKDYTAEIRRDARGNAFFYS